MFTIFDLIKSYDVNDEQRIKLFRRIKQFSEIEEGKWLNSINWQAVHFKWACNMTMDNGVMGCYVFVNNTIYLMPEDVYDSGANSSWVELLVPTVIHELRHKYQYEKSKALYILCALPLLREITIEKDAWKFTKIAENFCEEITASEDSFKFFERQKAKAEKEKNQSN